MFNKRESACSMKLIDIIPKSVHYLFYDDDLIKQLENYDSIILDSDTVSLSELSIIKDHLSCNSFVASIEIGSAGYDSFLSLEIYKEGYHE